MHFDARAAKLLPVGNHMVIEGAQGLRLVRSSAGHAWIYRYKSSEGKMRQIKLGQWPAMSIGAAVSALEKLRQARSQGADPAVEKRQARHAERLAVVERKDGPYTVARLVADFVAVASKSRKPKGAKELARTMATMLGPISGMMPAQVSRSVAYDLIQSYASIPVQASSLRRELGAAWEWGHDSGRLSADVPNWWRLILRGKLASAGKIIGGVHQGVVKRVLSPSEVGALLRHLPHVSRLISDLITMYLWTGCRGAEIVQIEGREVSQESDGWWWTVPKSKLKMGGHPLSSDLRVPLIGRALAVVQSRIDLHGDRHLFPPLRGKSQHVDQKVIGVAIWDHMPGCLSRPESVRARWPVSGWSAHDLRRTVRTQLSALGCPVDIAEAVIGHMPTGIVGTYDRHNYDAERRLWISRVAECWEADASR